MIRDLHSSEDLNSCPPGDTTESGKRLSTFLTLLLPPSSGWKKINAYLFHNSFTLLWKQSHTISIICLKVRIPSLT